jgi:hypothetical protein
MDTRIKNLITSIESQGWLNLGEFDDNQDWWADSILIIQSNWSPVGSKFYLTSLVEPDWGDYEQDHRKRNNRKPEEGVWAIAISSFIPKGYLDDFDLKVSLNELTKQKIKEVIKYIEKLR